MRFEYHLEVLFPEENLSAVQEYLREIGRHCWCLIAVNSYGRSDDGTLRVLHYFEREMK